MALSPEQAKQALDLGLISQDTYAMVPQPMATPIPEAPIAIPNEVARVASLQAEGFTPEGTVAAIPTPYEYLTPAQTKERGLTDLDMKKNFRASQVPSPLAMETDLPQQVASIETGSMPISDAMTVPKATDPIIPERSPAVQALAKEGEKEIVQGFKQAQYETGLNTAIDEQAQKAQEKQAKAKEALDKADLQFKTDSAKLDEQLSQMKPQDYWADKSTGNKIAAALAIALGGYASGMNGGPNQALGIVDGAIQRDALRQKENYERLKGRKDELKSVYAMARDTYKDDLTASLAVQKAGYDGLELKLKSIEQKTNDQFKKAQITNLLADTEQKRAETLAKIAERQRALNMQKVLTGGGKINPEMLGEKERVRYVDDAEFNGLARTEGEGVKFREGLPTYRQTVDSLRRLKEIARMPLKSLSPELRAEVEQNRQLLVGTLREDILGPGTIQQNERDALLNGVLGNPTGIMNLDAANMKKLDNLTNKIQSKKYDQARAIGLNVAAQAGNGLTDSVQMRFKYKDPQSGKMVDKVRPVPLGNMRGTRELIKKLGGTLEEV